jgi:hypothetical protein
MSKKNQRIEVIKAVHRNAERLRRDLHRAHFEALSAQHRRLVARAYAILSILDAVVSVARPARRGFAGV